MVERYNPKRLRSEAQHMISCLRERQDDKLCLDAAEEMDRMRTELFNLSNRIRNQRASLRENWQIIEMRAQYRRAWYPSPLLTSILNKSRHERRTSFWRRIFGSVGW